MPKNKSPNQEMFALNFWIKFPLKNSFFTKHVTIFKLGFIGGR